MNALENIISYTCLYERELLEQKTEKQKFGDFVIKLLKFVRLSKLLLNIMIFDSFIDPRQIR